MGYGRGAMGCKYPPFFLILHPNSSFILSTSTSSGEPLGRMKDEKGWRKNWLVEVRSRKECTVTIVEIGTTKFFQ